MVYFNKDITDTVKGLGWFPLFMFTIAVLGVGVNTIFSILDIGVYITVALSTALLVIASKKYLSAKALEEESSDDKYSFDEPLSVKRMAGFYCLIFCA
jgi:hypothetical protein